MKHKQKFQEGQFLKLKNAVFLNSPEILGEIRGKMQLNSIRFQDLECLQAFIPDAKAKNVIPLFLNQIKHAFINLGCIKDISIDELKYLELNVDNRMLAGYIEIIRIEMQSKKSKNFNFINICKTHNSTGIHFFL
jgi:hypothetical protein